jgi:D-apiose dehydrogenase
MTPLRGGLIGCGFFARNHLSAWRDLSQAREAEIVAVCDVNQDRAEQWARDFGVPHAYADRDTMLREREVDFMDIVTPPATHRSLVEWAARAGKHVICQKPMALSLADARAMVAACRDAGVRFMVHENFRWQSPMQELKLEAERLGELFFGRITFRTPYDVYRDQPYLAEDPRFVIADLGVHLLDLARFFLGEVEQVYCVTRHVNPRIRGEDTATMLLRMRSGAACEVDVSYSSQTEEDLFPQTLVTLEGTEGMATLGPHCRLTVTRDGDTVHRVAAAPHHDWTVPPFEEIQDSVYATQRHWIACLRAGREPDTSGEDNLRTLALVEAAYASNEQRRAIDPVEMSVG